LRATDFSAWRHRKTRFQNCTDRTIRLNLPEASGTMITDCLLFGLGTFLLGMLVSLMLQQAKRRR
jgi:hypothetical protein